MAKKLSKKDCSYVAKLVTDETKKCCAFCLREVDDEVLYGKLYMIGDIQCHYFCVLLSCCLVQKGKDHDGLFGFMYKDILIELERIKKHKCSYCGKEGANLGCNTSSCRKQFHLPCGREKNAVSLFHGTFKSYCQHHAPKQKIPEHIMENVRQRRKMKMCSNLKNQPNGGATDSPQEMVCVICYEEVDGFPTLNTFWPPCCARDAWFHRNCLQRMCLSAGMHYLKCPLCNDKSNFYEAVLAQGYFVPDQDAAWELEQNAFAEIYDRNISCDVEECLCPMGRSHDADSGPWAVRPCVLCGGGGAHGACGAGAAGRAGGAGAVCRACAPHAAGLDRLAARIHQVMAEERAAAERRGRRPVMRSRMSLRMTKGRVALNQPSSSRQNISIENNNSNNTTLSRQELNISSPKKQHSEVKSQPPTADNLISPLKILEQELNDKQVKLDEGILETLKNKFRKPRPLSVKKKIVNDVLGSIFEDVKKGTKSKDLIKEWTSPKKSVQDVIDFQSENAQSNFDLNSPKADSPAKSVLTIQSITEIDDSSTSTFELPAEFIGNDSEDGSLFDCQKIDGQKCKTVNIQQDSSLEISEKDESVNIDVIKVSPQKTDSQFKIKFAKKDELIDVENFKKEYLSEVGRGNLDQKCKENSQNNVKNAIDFDIKKEVSIKEENSITDREEKMSPDIKIGGKRKLSSKNGGNHEKRRKTETAAEVVNIDETESKENVIQNKKTTKRNKINKKRKKLLTETPKSSKKDIEVTIDSEETKKKNIKTKVSIKNTGIKLKIQWKKEKLHLKFESNKQKKIERRKYKQFVLKYYKEGSKEDLVKPKQVLVKPEKEVVPLKKTKIKLEKSPDKFKQMSLHNFFKVSSPNDK